LLKELREAYDRLLVIKKERNEGDDEQTVERDRIASLNFFSSGHPGLHLLHSAPIGEPNYFEQLQNIATLKRDGLLTEKEFKTLKVHLIKGLQSHE
jgi:hypothetical protein